MLCAHLPTVSQCSLIVEQYVDFPEPAGPMTSWQYFMALPLPASLPVPGPYSGGGLRVVAPVSPGAGARGRTWARRALGGRRVGGHPIPAWVGAGGHPSWGLAGVGRRISRRLEVLEACRRGHFQHIDSRYPSPSAERIQSRGVLFVCPLDLFAWGLLDARRGRRTRRSARRRIGGRCGRAIGRAGEAPWLYAPAPRVGTLHPRRSTARGREPTPNIDIRTKISRFLPVPVSTAPIP